MSPRKRKKTSAAESTADVESTLDERDDAESATEEAGPAVSQIKELRPRETEDVADAEEEQAPGDEEEESASYGALSNRAELKRVIESLLFVSDEIMTAQQIARSVRVKLAETREVIAELCMDYEGRGIELIEVNGGYQFRSAPASAAFVRDMVAQRPARLTRAQLETLALIAYRQPITRPEVDDVRGVDSGSAIKVLGERELVKILGRKDEAGRPLLYGTTPFFLEFFGLNSMQDLPTLREFTELTAEHRELFQRKTGEIPDLSAQAYAEQEARADAEAEADANAEQVEREALDDHEIAEAERELDEATAADGDEGPALDDEPVEAMSDDEPEAHA